MRKEQAKENKEEKAKEAAPDEAYLPIVQQFDLKWKQIQDEINFIKQAKGKTKEEYENMLEENNEKFVWLREYVAEKSYCL